MMVMMVMVDKGMMSMPLMRRFMLAMSLVMGMAMVVMVVMVMVMVMVIVMAMVMVMPMVMPMVMVITMVILLNNNPEMMVMIVAAGKRVVYFRPFRFLRHHHPRQRPGQR